MLGRQMATFLTKGRVGAFYIFNVLDQFISRLHKTTDIEESPSVARRSEGRQGENRARVYNEV